MFYLVYLISYTSGSENSFISSAVSFYFRHNHILTAIARIGKDGVSAADIRDTFLAHPQKKDKEQLHRK